MQTHISKGTCSAPCMYCVCLILCLSVCLSLSLSPVSLLWPSLRHAHAYIYILYLYYIDIYIYIHTSLCTSVCVHMRCQYNTFTLRSCVCSLPVFGLHSIKNVQHVLQLADLMVDRGQLEEVKSGQIRATHTYIQHTHTQTHTLSHTHTYIYIYIYIYVRTHTHAYIGTVCPRK